MRWLVVLGIVSLAPGALQNPPGVRVTGRITILEKRNKPSPDLGAAVIYLEGTGPAATPAAIDITINDKVYRPRVVVVPVGTTVRFPNTDPFDHNVFSVTEPNQFDLGLYGRGEAKTHTFTRPGLVRVYCNVHPKMVAYVVVMANRYYAQPGVDGSFTIPNVIPGHYRMHVWHERISAEIVKDVIVTASGAVDVRVALDARGYKWRAHKNKDGQEYPTNAGYERY
ncbi:MAG TPA: plastocyanin/azurin family copper-binding protein [Gemmatimonadales bacterium]|jgi:plastocyanin|nr:plastocyanin/azurin family copper-binding protein [Gemmatimonadales bacterium]